MRLNGLSVAFDQKSGISSLKCHRQALEEMFDLERVFFSPSTSIMHSHLLQMFDSVCVPAAEGFDDQRQKGNSLSAASIKVLANFGGLPHSDGGGGSFGGLKQYRLLPHLAADPIIDENIRGPRL